MPVTEPKTEPRNAKQAHDRIDQLIEALNLVFTSNGIPPITMYLESLDNAKREEAERG